MLEYFSCFKNLKGFLRYLQWLKNCQREGKQNGPQRFPEVTNEFVLWKVSMEVLTMFRMSSFPTIADGSCTIDSHKRWIEIFWKPLLVAESFPERILREIGIFNLVRSQREWQSHEGGMGSSFRGAWQSILFPAWLRVAKSLVKCHVFASAWGLMWVDPAGDSWLWPLCFRHQRVPCDHCPHGWAAGLYPGGGGGCRSDHLHLWEPQPWCGVQCQCLLCQGWPGESPHLRNHHTR